MVIGAMVGRGRRGDRYHYGPLEPWVSSLHWAGPTACDRGVGESIGETGLVLGIVVTLGIDPGLDPGFPWVSEAAWDRSRVGIEPGLDRISHGHRWWCGSV